MEAPLDLDAILKQVAGMMVSTFGFSEDETRQRINLWKAQQHALEGDLLASMSAGKSQSERDQALLEWAVKGLGIESDLRDGASKLGLTLDD
jgi:hypothetical protein